MNSNYSLFASKTKVSCHLSTIQAALTRKVWKNVHWNIKQLIEETMILIIIFLFHQKNGFPASIPNLAKKTNVYGKNKVADNAVVFLLQIWITRKMFIGEQNEQR